MNDLPRLSLEPISHVSYCYDRWFLLLHDKQGRLWYRDDQLGPAICGTQEAEIIRGDLTPKEALDALVELGWTWIGEGEDDFGEAAKSAFECLIESYREHLRLFGAPAAGNPAGEER